MIPSFNALSRKRCCRSDCEVNVSLETIRTAINVLYPYHEPSSLIHLTPTAQRALQSRVCYKEAEKRTDFEIA